MSWDNNGENLCFQMAARQRRGHNEQVPPPPPLAPTVQELMAQQNEILRQLLQRQPHQQHKALIEKFGGEITNVDEWGKKKLA